MALMTLKVDDELKALFTEQCKREGRSVSVVLRELMKSYTDTTDDYSPEFYAKIEKAMNSPISDMTEEEIFALHKV